MEGTGPELLAAMCRLALQGTRLIPGRRLVVLVLTRNDGSLDLGVKSRNGDKQSKELIWRQT